MAWVADRDNLKRKNGLTASAAHPFAPVRYCLGRSQDGQMGPSRSLWWQQPSISKLGLTLLPLGFKGPLVSSHTPDSQNRQI